MHSPSGGNDRAPTCSDTRIDVGAQAVNVYFVELVPACDRAPRSFDWCHMDDAVCALGGCDFSRSSREIKVMTSSLALFSNRRNGMQRRSILKWRAGRTGPCRAL